MCNFGGGSLIKILGKMELNIKNMNIFIALRQI